MGIFTLGLKKGVGGFARAINQRTLNTNIASQLGNATAKTGYFSPEKRALRKEKRATQGGGILKRAIANRKLKIADKKTGGGGFLRKAIDRRKQRKEQGLLKRQIRKKNKFGFKDLGKDYVGDPGSNFLGSGGAGAFFTGGDPGQDKPKEETNTIMDFITNNWIVILLIGVGIWVITKLSNQKRK